MQQEEERMRGNHWVCDTLMFLFSDWRIPKWWQDAGCDRGSSSLWQNGKEDAWSRNNERKKNKTKSFEASMLHELSQWCWSHSKTWLDVGRENGYKPNMGESVFTESWSEGEDGRWWGKDSSKCQSLRMSWDFFNVVKVEESRPWVNIGCSGWVTSSTDNKVPSLDTEPV